MQPGRIRQIQRLREQFPSPLTMIRNQPRMPRNWRKQPLNQPTLALLFITVVSCFVIFISRNQLQSTAAVPDFSDRSSLPTSASASTLPSPPRYRNLTAYHEQRSRNGNGIKNQILKVFMYDFPPHFHFGLLGWTTGVTPSVWPDLRAGAVIPQYPGGLNLQHSIEYWLTLDILSSEFSQNMSGRSAVRVRDSGEADVVFVPFFASISYNRFGKDHRHKNTTNRDERLQAELVKILLRQKEWQRSGGIDHIIVAHHPNSLLNARWKLWQSILITADFGRYPPTVANVEKDVIAPYKHLIPTYVDDDSDFDRRPILLYFKGAIYRKDGGQIRQELFYKLKEEKDVHFALGNIANDGISRASKGMQSSKFCLNVAGDTPSSNRLFDAIASHCVPVVISDEIELPFDEVLDYTEFCVFVRMADALKDKFLMNLIRGISKEKWTEMWRALKRVEHFFEFQYPSRENDAVQMIWQAVSRRVPERRRLIHQASRLTGVTVAGESYPLPFSATLPKNFW